MSLEQEIDMRDSAVCPDVHSISSVRNAPDSDLTRNKPFWFCKLLVTRPIVVFAVTLGCHISMLLLTALLMISGYDVFPVEFATVPLRLENDDTKLRGDAWQFVSHGGVIIGGQKKAGIQYKRGTTYQTIEFVYEMKNGNILARENLLEIAKHEKEMFENTVYQNELCNLEGDVCRLPLSILRLFDGSYKSIHHHFYHPDYQNITRVIRTAHSLNVTKGLLEYTLDKDIAFHLEKTPKSRYLRSLFYIGWPLDGYQSARDRKKEQMDQLDSYINKAFGGVLAKKFENGVGEMNFYYDNQALRKQATKEQVTKDMLLALLSFTFIVLFTWFQTGSLWITLWAIFGIISSFNITNLIYRIIFDYRYFGIFHILSIFIILGIGIDDVFIFVDTWNQSSKGDFSSISHRLSFVYKRAAKAMFITSFTTMVAFLSNVPSPLLAISSFGVFSAILIFVNYCCIVVFFPAVLIVHEQYRKGKCWCWLFYSSSPVLASDSEVQAIPVTKIRKTKGKYIIKFLQVVFFRYVVKHKIIRYVVLFCFLVLIAVSILFAGKLQPEEEQFKLWGANTNWEKVNQLRKTEFAVSEEDNVVKVYIIWGLRNQDRSECHHTDYKCRGRTVFDTRFDMNLLPCQRAVLNFCEKIKALPPDETDKLKLRRNQVTGEIEMECFMEKMQGYFQDECIKVKYPANTNYCFPLKSENMRNVMETNDLLYNVSMLSQDFYRYFEVGLGLFLTNGSKTGYANNQDYKKYSKYLGAKYDITASGKCDKNNAHHEQKYGNKLVVMAVAVNTTLQVTNLGFTSGLPIYDNWERFVKNEMNSMPPACNGAFQATVEGRNIWHWLKVQKVLIKNAIQGIVIGLLLALVVLVLTTTNFVIGILATLTIAMIMCSVLAMITIQGWNLGVLESLNMTLVVGLSVDYVVHIAEGYIRGTCGNRLGRTRQTLGHVGISVLSGACTTMGASIFLFASKIVFFKQFGIFIFCTIIFSTLYSLVFFTTLLALIGPEDNYGSILPAVKRVKDFFRGKKKNHEECQKCKGKGFHEKFEEAVIETSPVIDDFQL